MRGYLPSAKFRSPTALAGKSDIRHDYVYSSIVIAHAGTGPQTMFTVPKGQAIPSMRGAAIVTAAWPAHHLLHSEVTTNISKAGEFGNAVGDVAVRSVGLTIETAAPLIATSLWDTVYGATPQELNDAMTKLYFQFKIGAKVMTQGPFWGFPAAGGPGGTPVVSVTANNARGYMGFATNGPLLGGRRLRLPLQISRNDTVEGVLGTAPGSALAFSAAASPGQPCLVTALLDVIVRGDIR